MSLPSKKVASLLKSSAFPNFGIGCIASIAFLTFSLDIIFLDILDSVILGAIQFTLILGDNSAANDNVRASNAPFAEDMIVWFANPCYTANDENNRSDPAFFSKFESRDLMDVIAPIVFNL